MANIIASGTWWDLYDDGELYIHCVGDMPIEDDGGEPFPPWEHAISEEELDFWLDQIVNVRFADTVTDIGYGAFHETGLVNVSIPDSITAIRRYAFYACGSLASVTIPDSVASIGGDAFAHCANLTSVTIPASVTKIEGYTFYNCSSLTNVTIPDSVTEIYGDAFNRCSALTDVYYTGTETQWNAITIGEGNASLTSAAIHYNYAPPTPQPTAIPKITYTGQSKVIRRLCAAVNALIDRGGDTVALLISKTVTANGTYGAADENASGYSEVTVNVPVTIPGLLTPSAFDLDTGYVMNGAWTPGGNTVNYSDVYEAEADKPYLIALGDTVGTRFRAMFSETDTATATAPVSGTQIANVSNPASYACVLYTPSANGYITVTKDNAGTANIETYVFDIRNLIDGNASTNGGEQSGGE